MPRWGEAGGGEGCVKETGGRDGGGRPRAVGPSVGTWRDVAPSGGHGAGVSLWPKGRGQAL